MSKFDVLARAARGPSGPLATLDAAVTHEGGQGYARDAKSELFLLAVTNLVAENTFYEGGGSRDERFRQLVHTCTRNDPEWVTRLIPWLRNEANMRSASVVAAAEYARAGGPRPRQVIASALKRADEPAEFIAYWHANYGRTLAGGKQRGVADAALTLYNERSALKYDGASRAYRMADVIELVHPRPTAAWQADLFRYLLDKRHHPEDAAPPDTLPMIRADQELLALPEPERRAALTPDNLARAGWTWERLSGWLPGGMDAAAWEAVIPEMGYMALLRNLRNFDEAGVSDDVAAAVCARLSDPEQVAKSRQFPLRFLSAYKATANLRWAHALETAVNHSLGNVPSLPGRTLVLIDCSGSMFAPLSARGELLRSEAAGLFGAALGVRSESADVYLYGSQYGRLEIPKGASVLPLVRNMPNLGGTYTWQTFDATYQGHDRTVILTDEQAHFGGGPTADVNAPIYTFDLAGYAVSHMENGPKRVTVGGLSDAGFRMIDLLERRQAAGWPF